MALRKPEQVQQTMYRVGIHFRVFLEGRRKAVCSPKGEKLNLGIPVVVKNADSELSPLRLESWLHSAVRFCANYLISICKLYLSAAVVRIKR